MMSSEKHRLHPISAIINFVKNLKDLLIPIIIIIAGNGFNFSITFNWKDDAFWENIPTLILLIALFFILISGIIKWWKFVYWFEDNELRVEYGLFVKKKRYIPFERIQSLNYNEGIFHRIFKLVQVKVETAGSKDAKAEAELTAITKMAAEQIEAEMRRAKSAISMDERVVEKEVILQPATEVIHKMTSKNILLLASTSGAVGVVLSGIAALLSQVTEYIPYEKIFNEVSTLVRVGVLLIALLVFIVFVITWIISVVITAFNYYDFTVSKEEEKLIITRGLLEKKRTTIPLNRVQAIQVVENPIRQIFGLATVVLETASGTGEGGKKMMLFPLVKKGDEVAPLSMLFPDYDFTPELTTAPKKARPFFYRIDFLWMIPVIAVCSYYFYPYGLLSFLLIPLLVSLGFWQHKTVGFSVKDRQLTMRSRGFSRVTIYMQKHRIQAMASEQSYFQKKKQVATVRATVMSGLTGTTSLVKSIENSDAEAILNWFDHQVDINKNE